MASSTSTTDSTSKYNSPEVSGSVFLISSDGRVLELPVPSRSPRDPLGWSPRNRFTALCTIILFSVIALVQVQGPSLMFEQLGKEFSQETTKSLGTLLSGPTLAMGLAAFLWIPLSLAIGRRPVFLICAFLMLFTTIGAAASRSFGSLLAALCIQGLAGGLATSAILCMLIDLTFIHQRPLVISIFWSLGSVIELTFLSFVPKLVRVGGSWRAFYIFWAIPSATACLLVFFFFPETYFKRPAVAFDGRVLLQSATEKVQIYQDWEEIPGGKGLPDIPDTVGFARSFHTTKDGWRSMAACYPQILMCFVNPLIFWVALLNAVVFGSMMSIGITYASVLAAPPYNLSLNSIALVNLAGAVGAALAWPASGILVTRLSRRLTIRNAGVKDAEHYLPAFILPIITGAASVFLYGVSAERKLHFLFIYLAYALNTIATIGLGTANTLWVTEAFPRWAAPALVIVGGSSYMTSFGMSFVIIPWMQRDGIMKMNAEIGLLILLVGCLGIPIAMFGKGFRVWIHERYGMKSESGALRPQ